MLRKAVALTVLFLPFCALASPSTWPKMSGDATYDALCSQALQIATHSYHSKHAEVSQLRDLPKNLDSNRVFGADIEVGKSIYGQHDVFFDPAVFKKKSSGDTDSVRNFYWQIQETHGRRYVIKESSIGWRGDIFDFFSIPASIPDPEHITAENAKEVGPEKSRENLASWEPPLVMQDKRSGTVWAIVTTYNEQPDHWYVYTIDRDGMQRRCVIAFRPDVETALVLLPAAVRKLAVLLDGTLGSGENEGTLHPTARLRAQVEELWANVATRPWAVLDGKQPYNDRRQVDAELKKWSRQADSFGRLYQDVLAQYPKAEQALKKYYKNKFGKDDADAQMMAEKITDIAFRNYFIFSRQ